MIGTSNLIAIALLIVAIADTLVARYVLPSIFAKNTHISEAQKKLILALINGMTFVFAAIAIFIYFTQALG